MIKQAKEKGLLKEGEIYKDQILNLSLSAWDFCPIDYTEVPKLIDNEILFKDGTKGQVKVERTGDKIKLYCSSDSDKKSMLMAMETSGIYIDGEDYYDHTDDPIIYKSTENEHQYVVEFNDTNKDKTFEVFLGGFISGVFVAFGLLVLLIF